MSKRIECFTVYWNEEFDKVTIKITPQFKADPIMMYYGLEQIMSELEKVAKKNFKKAEKAGLDLHLGCDAWPECDESPGGCDHYNASFSDLIQRDKFKFLLRRRVGSLLSTGNKYAEISSTPRRQRSIVR